MLLKQLDTSKNFIRHISEYSGLKIERQLENGDEALYFTYPGKQSDILNEEYIVTDRQRYVVKEVRPMESTVEYVCKLDLEALEANMIQQFTAKDQTCTAAARLALVGTGWSVVADSEFDFKTRSVQQFKKSPLEILYKIRDAFMCEIWFDSIGKIVHFDKEIGEDKGVYARPELNLVSIDPTFDSYDYYTRIIPIGADGLTIEDVNNGKSYIENYQYSQKVRTLIWEDTSYEDANALKNDAIEKLKDISKPKRSYSAKVRDLAKISDQYSILSFDVGDTIHITDESKDVMDKQRIVKITEYPDAPENNEIEISNTVLTWEELQAKLKAAADAWESVSNADGTVNGVYVHGVQADGIVGIEVLVNDEISSNKTIGAMQGAINTSSQAVTEILEVLAGLDTNYAKTNMSNVTSDVYVTRYNPDGYLVVKNYEQNESYPVVSGTDTGSVASAVSTDGTANLAVKGQWQGQNFVWKNLQTHEADMRLISNETATSTSGLALIDQLPLYEFDWTDRSEHVDIGLIADYLETIDANLSVGGGYASDGGMNVKSINTPYLQALMVKAIQELSAQVRALQAQVAALQS